MESSVMRAGQKIGLSADESRQRRAATPANSFPAEHRLLPCVAAGLVTVGTPKKRLTDYDRTPARN